MAKKQIKMLNSSTAMSLHGYCKVDQTPKKSVTHCMTWPWFCWAN